MHIISVPAFTTNYIWIIYNDMNECIIVDPGESEKVLKILKRLKLSLQAILLTHNHYDHIAGVHILVQHFPRVLIYGPTETKHQCSNLIVSEGDEFTLLNKKITVFNFPGHTENHIGFYYDSHLFCGDTVFSAGCGHIQTGLTQKMYTSFLKIKDFPESTLIYSGHEYTLSNINFVSSILPKNKHVINYRTQVINALKFKKLTIPTTLKLELKINPFFRCNSIDVQQALCLSYQNEETWKIFHELRKRKNEFNNTQARLLI